MKTRCVYCNREFDVDTYKPSHVKCPLCGKNTVVRTPRELMEADKEAKKQRNSSIFGCLGIIVVMGLIVWGLASCVSGCNENTRKRNIESMKNGDLIEAKMLCEDRINSILKAPSTAKIVFETKDKSDSSYRFSGYVDAQNSFGAMIRNRFSAKMLYVGNGTYKFEEFNLQ